MSIFYSYILVMSLCFFFVFISFGLDLECDHADREALLDFSSALDSPLWPSPNKSTTDCCQWAGVQCDPVHDSPYSGQKKVSNLILGSMKLSGPMSGSLGKLDYLRVLNLSRNNFSGSIPEELFEARSLERIDFRYNSFSGPLSSAVGNLSNLVFLVLNNNKLSGNIPDAFHGLNNLEDFDAYGNSFSGPLPPSLSSCSPLQRLRLDSNNLSGRLDFNFSKLQDLEILILFGNHFTGRFPRSILSCRNLTVLDLMNNQLHGQIPWGFQLPSSIRLVRLSGNKFSNITRALLSLQGCRSLELLALGGNFRKEKMPADEIMGFPLLKYLEIANSELSGVIPFWLSASKELSSLTLGGNYLTGKAPMFLTQLNNLTGPEKLPLCIFHKSRLFATHVCETSGAIDLSSNLLSGNTWMRFSNLKLLTHLNLSHNLFSGSIPGDFSKLKWLETLDLSSNRISGTIPASLNQLTFLSFFCVANNNIHGDVPSGSQFSTFPSSCFDGNPGLCEAGMPGCHSLPPSASTHDDEQDEEAYQVMDTGVPFAIGVSIGYAVTFLVCMIHYCWIENQQLMKRKSKTLCIP